MSYLPVLAANADSRTIAERVNRLIRFFNVATNAAEVADLPSAVTEGDGARALVTDADTPVLGDVVVGGGAIRVGVISDGTDWRVG